MNQVEQIISDKRKSIHLEWDDLYAIGESAGWRDRYPRGPVRFSVRCKLCGEIIADDFLYECVEDRAWCAKNISPHIIQNHINKPHNKT